VRLTNYTDYTLRMLIYLALKTEGRATIAEISARYGIAETHLMKVAHELGIAGDIETIRGKGGGLRLARRPEAIRVGEIVRRTEPDLAIVPCFSEQAVCAIEPECVLQRAMQKALQTFLAELDGYSLADLVAPRRKLSALLDIQPSDPGRGPEAGRRTRKRPRRVVA
jgi:Rrf2 family transcriptional regulator, nitric oxide-sensitive transcriptional repressor